MTTDRRTLLKGTLAVGVALPARVLAQGDGAAAISHVNPELRPILDKMRAYQNTVPPLSRATLAQHRAFSAKFTTPPLAAPAFAKRRVPGATGQPDVAVYVVNAKPGTHRPAILHTHGGGFVTGSAGQSISMLQELCKALDCVAVTVDYRLAPETTYRGSIEDNYAGLKWLHGNAAELGVDSRRIAVMGESAGGGHAALLAITARDRGEVPLAFQCLTYPMLDDRTGSSRAVAPHIGQIVWTAASNRFGWESFLGMAPGGPSVPVPAVPARTADLKGLPPAFIGVGGIDLFVDEDIDYAQRLNAAGVATELIVVPGAFHGFDSLPMPLKLIADFKAARLDALRAGLA